jgi:putative endonuclease
LRPLALAFAFAFAFAFLSVIPSEARNLLPARSAYNPPMPTREYSVFVYILSSRSRNLYIGMTNNLRARIDQHRERPEGSHTAHYNIHRLLYFERFQYVRSAIARETALKTWTREKKITLIEKVNPTWANLAEQW